jgi:predicted acetyltransferase
MAVDIRPLETDDARIQLEHLVTLSFGVPAESTVRWFGHLDPGAFRAAFVGDRVVGGLAYYPMGQLVGGRRVPTVGLAGVAVRPELRRRGVARALLVHALEEMRASGAPTSVLYASTQVLYRGVGFEHAAVRTEMRVPLSAIDRGGDELEVRHLGADDAAAVHDVYARYAARINGHLDRHPILWTRIREGQGAPTYGYGIFDGSTLLGYVYLSHVSRDPHFELRVSDRAFLTAEAGRAILGLIRQHGSLVDQVTWYGAPQDPLLALCHQNRAKLGDFRHLMTRLLDVKAALEARGYPLATRAELHLAVDDPLIAANCGRFVLRLEGGRGYLEPGGRGEVGFTIRGLAAVFSGHLGAQAARLAGLLDGPPELLGLVDACFGAPSPWLPDMF